jgi:hypothetical protein
MQKRKKPTEANPLYKKKKENQTQQVIGDITNFLHQIFTVIDTISQKVDQI